MRISCPVCAAAYEVPDNLLAPGRPVRCARCATDWVALPAPEPEPLPEPEPEPIAPPVAPVAAAPPPSPLFTPPVAPARSGAGGGLLLALAWAASLCVVGGVLWAAYAERDAVVRAWPPSLRAYRALGVAPAAAAPHD